MKESLLQAGQDGRSSGIKTNLKTHTCVHSVSKALPNVQHDGQKDGFGGQYKGVRHTETCISLCCLSPPHRATAAVAQTHMHTIVHLRRQHNPNTFQTQTQRHIDVRIPILPQYDLLCR